MSLFEEIADKAIEQSIKEIISEVIADRMYQKDQVINTLIRERAAEIMNTPEFVDMLKERLSELIKGN